MFISDTYVHALLTPEELVDIAIQSRRLGHEPRVAPLSHSNFSAPMRGKAHRVREAMALLNVR